ncbi:MAG: hypothetical protein ACLQU4_07370 [Limisphaerales bacterium]
MSRAALKPGWNMTASAGAYSHGMREAVSEVEQAGYPPRSLSKILRVRFKVINGVRTIPDLDTAELLNLSRTLAARLASLKKWQTLLAALRSILVHLAHPQPRQRESPLQRPLKRH